LSCFALSPLRPFVVPQYQCRSLGLRHRFGELVSAIQDCQFQARLGFSLSGREWNCRPNSDSSASATVQRCNDVSICCVALGRCENLQFARRQVVTTNHVRCKSRNAKMVVCCTSELAKGKLRERGRLGGFAHARRLSWSGVSICQGTAGHLARPFYGTRAVCPGSEHTFYSRSEERSQEDFLGQPLTEKAAASRRTLKAKKCLSRQLVNNSSGFQSTLLFPRPPLRKRDRGFGP
jgi:hypothetical protein